MCSLLRTGNVAKFLNFTLSPKKQKRSTIDYKTRGVRLHDDPKERLRIKLYRLQHLAIPCSVWVFFGKQDNCSSMCTHHHKLFCHTTDYCRPCQTNVLSLSVSFSMIAKQFLLSAAKDQKALTSSKLQFIDATVKSELFVHEGNYPDTDSGSFTCSSAIILFHYVTGLATILFKFHVLTA